MTADDLLAIADDLVRRETGRPRQTSLKRAVSTAYYAVFHALAHESVAQTIGWRFRSPGYWKTVTPMYRAIDHGNARTVFQRIAREAKATPDLQTVAEIFVDLQAARIRADYDPQPAFSRKDAVLSIDLARRAITLLRALPDDVRRSLVVQLITKSR